MSKNLNILAKLQKLLNTDWNIKISYSLRKTFFIHKYFRYTYLSDNAIPEITWNFGILTTSFHFETDF